MRHRGLTIARGIFCGALFLTGLGAIGYELAITGSPRIWVLGLGVAALFFPIFTRVGPEEDDQ